MSVKRQEKRRESRESGKITNAPFSYYKPYSNPSNDKLTRSEMHKIQKRIGLIGFLSLVNAFASKTRKEQNKDE